jgi:hypothetical protein
MAWAGFLEEFFSTEELMLRGGVAVLKLPRAF